MALSARLINLPGRSPFCMNSKQKIEEFLLFFLVFFFFSKWPSTFDLQLKPILNGPFFFFECYCCCSRCFRKVNRLSSEAYALDWSFWKTFLSLEILKIAIQSVEQRHWLAQFDLWKLRFESSCPRRPAWPQLMRQCCHISHNPNINRYQYRESEMSDRKWVNRIGDWIVKSSRCRRCGWDCECAVMGGRHVPRRITSQRKMRSETVEMDSVSEAADRGGWHGRGNSSSSGDVRVTWPFRLMAP